MFTKQFKTVILILICLFVVVNLVLIGLFTNNRITAVEKQVQEVQSKFLPAKLTPAVTVIPTATPSSTLKTVTVTKSPVVTPTVTK